MSTIAPTELILSRDEAMTRAKITNPTSFFRWRKRYGLKPLSRDRYALRAVDKAIERETRGVEREPARA